METRRVILASSDWKDYEFLAPITALLFRRVAGFEPMVLLTESETAWRARASGRCVLETLEREHIDHAWIGPLEGYRISVAAQAARQHAACLPFADDDYLVTSDVDMWPLDRAWFNQIDSRFDVQLWYANAYNYRFHTTGYVGMRAGLWREIMGIKVGDKINERLQVALDANFTRNCDTWSEWYADETYTSSRLKAWKGYPDKCQMIERRGAPPEDRIDRSGWPSQVNLVGKVDAHVLRPGFTGENWPRLSSLLDNLICQEDVRAIKLYRESYVEAVR